MNTLEERIVTLEKSNQRYQTILSIFVIITISLLCLGAVKSNKITDVIQAKRFEVVDEKGNILIELSGELGAEKKVINKNQGKAFTSVLPGAISTYNSQGKEAVRLGTFQDNGTISTCNSKGKEIISLWGIEDNGAIWTYNSLGKEAVMIGTFEGNGTIEACNGNGKDMVRLWGVKGDGLISTYNNQGKEVVCLGVSEDSDGTISTFNKQGKEIVRLGATKGGKFGTISTLNGQSKEIVRLWATTNYDGMISTFNKQGKEIVVLGATDNGGAINVRNKTNQTVCTLETDKHGNGEIGAWNRKGKGRTLTPEP